MKNYYLEHLTKEAEKMLEAIEQMKRLNEQLLENCPVDCEGCPLRPKCDWCNGHGNIDYAADYTIEELVDYLDFIERQKENDDDYVHWTQERSIDLWTD